MTRQKILFTIDSLFVLGTPAHQLMLLASGLIEQGFEVHVVSLSDPNTIRHAMPASVTVHFIGRAEKRDYLRSVRLRSLVKQIKPDIFHAWGIDAHRTSFIATMGLDRCAKVCTYLEFPPARQMILGRWLHESLTNEDVTSVVAHEAIADALVADAFDCEFVVIGNAVENFSKNNDSTIRTQIKKHLEIPDDTFIAMSIAKFQPRTRLKDLIWAADLLYCIRDDVHLILVGYGAQEKRLKKFLWQTEAGPNVHFLDPRDPSLSFLTADFIGAADVYWNSHLGHANSSPMLMAMGQGVPVISVLGPGTENLILHQQSAMAVNFGARDEFARWTKYVIEQKESTKQLALQGQQFVERLDSKTMVEKYLNCYG